MKLNKEGNKREQKKVINIEDKEDIQITGVFEDEIQNNEAEKVFKSTFKKTFFK